MVTAMLKVQKNVNRRLSSIVTTLENVRSQTESIEGIHEKGVQSAHYARIVRSRDLVTLQVCPSIEKESAQRYGGYDVCGKSDAELWYRKSMLALAN